MYFTCFLRLVMYQDKPVNSGMGGGGVAASIKKSIASGNLQGTEATKLKLKPRCQVMGLSPLPQLYKLPWDHGHVSPFCCCLFFGLRPLGRRVPGCQFDWRWLT